MDAAALNEALPIVRMQGQMFLPMADGSGHQRAHRTRFERWFHGLRHFFSS
jgi:hypothetical protein